MRMRAPNVIHSAIAAIQAFVKVANAIFGAVFVRRATLPIGLCVVLSACSDYQVGSSGKPVCIRSVTGVYADAISARLRALPGVRVDAACVEPYTDVTVSMTRSASALDGAGLDAAYTYAYTVALSKHAAGRTDSATLTQSVAFYRSDAGPVEGLNVERMRGAIAQRIANGIRYEAAF